jgi:hypothetical protein
MHDHGMELLGVRCLLFARATLEVLEAAFNEFEKGLVDRQLALARVLLDAHSEPIVDVAQQEVGHAGRHFDLGEPECCDDIPRLSTVATRARPRKAVAFPP